MNKRTGRGTSRRGGNPPKHTQFSRGTSGNPKGRPKGSKNLGTYIMQAARDKVSATVNGRTRKISKLQATTMQLATKAAGGDHVAIGKLLDWVDEVETRAASKMPSEFPIGDADIEVIRCVYERMKQCDPLENEEE
jgi:adenylosuccinate synthase